LKKAKTIVEQAKARQLHSGTDSQDLDYVRTQTGQKHQEDMEKQQQKDNNSLRNKVVEQNNTSSKV